VRQYFGKTALIILLHDATHRLVTSEMVLDGSGLVDEFIPYVPEKTTVRKLRTMASLGRRLRHKRFDAVVSLLPSDRPRWALVRDRLFFRTCGIRRLIGFQPFEEAQFRPRDEFGRPAPTPNEAIFRVERLVAGNIASPQENYFALPLMQVSREHSDAVDGWLTSRRVYPQRPLIALCPGCKKPGNSWPRERFLDIAKRLLALNQHELLILGGPAERELAACLVDGLGGRAIHAAGCFSISESAALRAAGRARHRDHASRRRRGRPVRGTAKRQQFPGPVEPARRGPHRAPRRGCVRRLSPAGMPVCGPPLHEQSHRRAGVGSHRQSNQP
jgi:hypothetical protein